MNTGEWKSVNRRTALAHAMVKNADNRNIQAETIVADARVFENFLNGEQEKSK